MFYKIYQYYKSFLLTYNLLHKRLSFKNYFCYYSIKFVVAKTILLKICLQFAVILLGEYSKGLLADNYYNSNLEAHGLQSVATMETQDPSKDKYGSLPLY